MFALGGGPCLTLSVGRGIPTIVHSAAAKSGSLAPVCVRPPVLQLEHK